MPPKKRLTVAESRAIEAKKLKEFEQKRAEMKAKIESKKALQASEARAYNQTQRKIKEDQVQDYSKRKGQTLEYITKWLQPVIE